MSDPASKASQIIRLTIKSRYHPLQERIEERIDKYHSTYLIRIDQDGVAQIVFEGEPRVQEDTSIQFSGYKISVEVT